MIRLAAASSREQVVVQALAVQAIIKAVDETVLLRLALFDVMTLDLVSRRQAMNS